MHIFHTQIIYSQKLDYSNEQLQYLHVKVHEICRRFLASDRSLI